MNIKYSEGVFVALVIQHANRMRRIILSCVTCPAPPYSSTLSHKGHDFQKKVIKNVFLSPQILSETFHILRRTQRDIIINVYRSSCKLSLFLVRCW
jgi:hypothetical protein